MLKQETRERLELLMSRTPPVEPGSNMTCNATDGRVFAKFVELGFQLSLEPDEADWLASQLVNCAKAARALGRIPLVPTMRVAMSWLADRKLPTQRGFLSVFEGRPFGWDSRVPKPETIEPGAVVISLATHEMLVATGGDPMHGATLLDCIGIVWSESEAGPKATVQYVEAR